MQPKCITCVLLIKEHCGTLSDNGLVLLSACSKAMRYQALLWYLPYTVQQQVLWTLLGSMFAAIYS